MNTYPLVHNFDKKAVKSFIEASDDSVKDICRKIINATKYISFEKTLVELNNRIKEYYLKFNKFHIENNRPIFIFNPDDKYYQYKSNYWFSSYIYNELKKIFNNKIKIISITETNIYNHPELIQDDIIIFPDDCVYSGRQLSSIIYEFANIGNKFRFYILISYASKEGIELIKKEYLKSKKDSDTSFDKKRLIFSTYIQIPSLRDTISETEFNKLSLFYDSLEENNIDYNTYLIYFDHKLADINSVPTVFYLGVVPNKKNRTIITSPSFSGLYSATNLDVIPLIEKCSHYKTKIDLASPHCPKPPYKKDFDSFVQKIKDTYPIKAKSLSQRNYSKRNLKKYIS